MKKPFVPPAKTATARCKTCNSSYRREIEVGFVLGTNRVDSFQDRFNQSYKGAKVHWDKHCSPEYKALVFEEARTHKAVGIVDGERTNILHTLERLSADCVKFLAQAHQDRDIRGGVAVVTELRRLVADTAKILASQSGSSEIILSTNPAWQQVKAAIMETLNLFPEAKQHFLSRLGHLAIEDRNE